MNFIRDLKQQEKYKNMLKRKNKEKNIYKTQNETLRIKYEGVKKLLDKKDKEIKALNNKIGNAVDKINYFLGSEYTIDMELFDFLVDLRRTIKDGDGE